MPSCGNGVESTHAATLGGHESASVVFPAGMAISIFEFVFDAVRGTNLCSTPWKWRVVIL
jgi:hypothetical protein